MKLKRMALIFLILAGLSPKVAAEELPYALVECQSSNACDKNPKHLKEFVWDFYQWFWFGQMATDGYSQTKDLQTDWTQEPGKTIVQTALTKRFFNSLPSSYKFDNTNPFLRSIANYEDWVMDEASVRMVSVTENTAIAEMTFGLPSKPIALFRIGMKVENGAWRFNSITEVRKAPLPF